MNPILRFLVLLLPISLCGIGIPCLSVAQTQPISSLSYQQQAIDIIKVLRCPMATNQSLLESQAPIAHELKAQIFSMLEQGQSQDEIIDFMVQRYGQKIRYQPEFKASTFALWFGPLLLLVLGVGLCLALVTRRKTQTTI